MITVLSPAKSLDFDTPSTTEAFTQPDFLKDSRSLMRELRKLSREELSALMKISPKLADLNHERNAVWKTPFKPENAKVAVLAFKGDVYVGMDAATYTQADFDFAQNHLRILSGLYGMLRPLDLIRAYRLEMGTKLSNPQGKNLYEFWDDKITRAINKALKQSGNDVLLNLASNEYFKVVKPKLVKGKIITPVFKEFKNGEYKVISFLAKKARGMMASYIVKNRINQVEGIKAFTQAGYLFQADVSTETVWEFHGRK